MKLKGERPDTDSDGSEDKNTDLSDSSMRSETRASFVNGIIVGAGAVVAVMAYAFTRFVGQIEGIQNVTTTETRVAILLGGIVAAAAAGYEIYRKKGSSSNEDEKKHYRSHEETSSYQHGADESSQQSSNTKDEVQSTEKTGQGSDIKEN